MARCDLSFCSRKNAQSTTTFDSTAQQESDDDAKSEVDRLDIPSDIEDEQTTDESTASDGSTESEPEGDDVPEFQELIDEENIEDSRASNLSLEEMRVSVRQLVQRVRSFVKFIRGNRAINDYVRHRAESNQPPIRAGLVIDFEVRWNSTFVMLDRFINHRAIVNELAMESSKIATIN